MPIKLPKGFPRRKSSGNALEELQNPPQPSFRVFERPSSAGKSLDGGNTLKRMSDGRPLSASQYPENYDFEDGRPNATLANRGSGGTNNSSSSGGLYDTSSSSARFSSSSTLPSSSSIEASADESSHPQLKTSHTLPNPPTSSSPQTFSLRAAGRTLTFGRKTSQQIPPDTPALPNISNGTSQDYGIVPRSRAMTETSYASASTATPPRLLDTNLDFGQSGDLDGFGNMFDGFGSKKTQSPEKQEASSSPTASFTQPPERAAPAPPRHAYLSKRLPNTPPPLNLDRYEEIVASPYSCDSNDSRQGLMSSLSPREEHRGLQSDEYNENLPTLQRPRNAVNSRPTSLPKADGPGNPIRSQADYAVERTNAYPVRRQSTPLYDNDAMLVMDSVNASRRLNRNSDVLEGSERQTARSGNNQRGYERPHQPKAIPREAPAHSREPQSQSSTRPQGSQHIPVTLNDGPNLVANEPNSWPSESLNTTPRAKKPDIQQQDDSLLFDPSFRHLAEAAMQCQEKELSPRKQHPQSKVMTPAQFERYRKEQEMSRSKSNESKSEASGDDSDNYDDEDEAERTKQLVKQRRKQEAHLAVYRQQMMKVTGEQPSTLTESGQKRPYIDRTSLSTPNLGSRRSTMNLAVGKSAKVGKASDDEDEDIPLGILAAHGFPSKDRPPGHLDKTGSAPTIRYASETYPPPPASVTGGSVAGGARGNLPPFARNLPKDPYYGASIVNHSNREQLAFGTNSGASVFGESQPAIHPGGLVGVIASEERARAARRGSPNAQGGYGVPNVLGSLMPLPPGMNPMSMPPMPMMSPGDHAQIQMSQQMTQMMQMQMHWMQQMQQMVGVQGIPPGQPTQMLPQSLTMSNNGFLSPPGIQVHRPISMGSNSTPNMPLLGQQQQQRAMSMIDSGVSSQWAQQAQGRYQASMAPSLMNGALGPGQGYSPSIAPSERSNIGQPSRYRPISIAPVDDTGKPSSRASTLTSGTALQGWNQKKDGVQTTVKVVGGDKKKIGRTGAGSDDDDEEGWEEMKAKREKKKSTWRLKKRNDQGLGDVFYPGT